MIWVRSDGFKRLLSRSRDMIHELVIKVPVQSVLRPSSIIRRQLYCSELGIEESRMVTVKPVLNHRHRPKIFLRDTYFAEEAVFWAIGLDSSHPRYCFSHSIIAASFWVSQS